MSAQRSPTATPVGLLLAGQPSQDRLVRWPGRNRESRSLRCPGPRRVGNLPDSCGSVLAYLHYDTRGACFLSPEARSLPRGQQHRRPDALPNYRLRPGSRPATTRAVTVVTPKAGRARLRAELASRSPHRAGTTWFASILSRRPRRGRPTFHAKWYPRMGRGIHGAAGAVAGLCLPPNSTPAAVRFVFAL